MAKFDLKPSSRKRRGHKENTKKARSDDAALSPLLTLQRSALQGK